MTNTKMGNTTEFTDVQKTRVTDTLDKESKPQKIIAKEAGFSKRGVAKDISRK